MRKLIGLAAAVAGCAVFCSPASALTAPTYEVRPMKLPTAGARAASVEPGRWLVGARPAANVAKVAERFGASPLRLQGTFTVSRDRARGLAAALRSRHDLVYAEPDVTLHRSSVPDSAPAGRRRATARVRPTRRARRRSAASWA